MGGCASVEQGLHTTGGKQSRRIAKRLAPGEQFTDPAFPPASSSLHYDPDPPFHAWRDAVWRRASEAFPGVELFRGRAWECVVEQGLLGNCWFISALSIIAERPEILQHLVVAQYPPQGLFEFRFFKEGRWVNVVIDDHLPFKPDGTLLFARGAAGDQLWVPLLEKAYAKLHGSYQALSGGEVSYALVDLTGGASEYIRLDSVQGRNLQAKDWLTEKMRQCRAEAWLMGCSFRAVGFAAAAGPSGEQAGACGLIAGHSYALLDIQDVTYRGQPVSLIKLRNPWGRREWRGAWSDGAAEWQETVGLSHPAAEDGIFWMAYADWVQNAAYFSVCRTYRNNIGPPFYVITEPNGAWIGPDAGGMHSCKNPQYLIMAEKTTAAFVFLMQDDHRYRSQRGNYDYASKALGMCFANAFDGERLGPELFRPSCFLFGTPFFCGRSIGAEVVLEEGECFSVMPCLQQPKEESRYQLYVFSTKPVRMKKTTSKIKEEDEYESIPLRSVTKQVEHAWKPHMRDRTFSGAPNVPSAMETDRCALDPDRGVCHRG
eukprot:EG_transcript_5214